MSFNHSPKIVTNGLVMYLDAGSPKSYGGSGTVWTDISRNGNNGTLVNGPTYSSANGGSIVFDGINDYISTSSLSMLLSGSTNLTLSIWIYPTNLNTIGYKTVVDTPSRQLSIWMGLEGKGQFYGVGDRSGPYTTNFNWENNKWQMMTVIVNSSSVQIIKNNYTVVESVLRGNIFNQQITFGNNPSGGGSNIAGSYGKISFYNRALSPAEVLQNYNATKSRFGL